MRTPGLALTLLLLGAVPVLAQNRTTTPVPAAGSSKLDQLLIAWEQKMRATQTLVAECEQADLDKTWGKTTVKKGTFHFKRPDRLILELNNPKQPSDALKIISSGKFIYEYEARAKRIRVYEIPQNPQGKSEGDTILALLSGMSAQQAKQRYQLALAREDDWYYYVQILPRSPRDQQDFIKAELVLYKRPPTPQVPVSYELLPARIWFAHPNGNQTTMTLKRLQPNVPLDDVMFVAPPTPKGWKVERVQRAVPNRAPEQRNFPPKGNQPPPTKVRPQGDGGK